MRPTITCFFLIIIIYKTTTFQNNENMTYLECTYFNGQECIYTIFGSDFGFRVCVCFGGIRLTLLLPTLRLSRSLIPKNVCICLMRLYIRMYYIYIYCLHAVSLCAWVNNLATTA